MKPLCDVDECDDDAVDLVVDCPVRTHAHIVEEIVVAADFFPDGHQVGQHFPHVLDQLVMFELM
jgi:hypothetical protein